MKIENRKELDLLLGLLKSAGVRVYEGDGTRIEFGADMTEPKSKPAPSDEKCLCGCFIYDHVNGACISGCTLEKCAGPEGKS